MSLSTIETLPPASPGFMGEGHTAIEVLAPDDLQRSDPFILLMDDRMNVPQRKQMGGAHPHAGLETVTLVLEGHVRDRDEGDLGPGDAVWMTAGSGIVHSESIEMEGHVRVLQLWVRMPKDRLNEKPGFEIIRAARVPTFEGRVRLYSGRSGRLVSPTQNHVPVTLLDVRGDYTHVREPGDNGFVYMISGESEVSGRKLHAGQVGWVAAGASELTFKGDGRAIVYLGQPQRAPIIQYGPFVSDSREGIAALYQRYRAGHGFVLMSELKERIAS